VVEGLAGVLIVQCYGAPKLTTAAREGEGDSAELTEAKVRRHGGEVAPVAVLGVEQVEARRSETRSGTSCGVVL
jgi:hypothetical protein